MPIERRDILPGYSISRILKGSWHLSSGHGPGIERDQAIRDMAAFVEAGVTTFDCADIYTGVEVLIGRFRAAMREAGEHALLERHKVHTKFVPDLDKLATITEFATGGLRPDLVAYLDIDVQAGLRRKQQHAQDVDPVGLPRVQPGVQHIDAHVRARIAGLKPGFYTRIGAAVRHSASGLAKRPNRKKLLLVLTDGRPNDLDHYEGRYGIEDTRRAVIEARRQGLAVFGVTVDAKARAYFPYIFGANGFAIVSRPESLSAALPIVWQHLVSG